MVTPVALDFGNSGVKAKCANKEGFYHTDIAKLTDAQWNAVQGRGEHVREGYALINGQPYAFGKVARHYHILRPSGVARYTPQYYGAGAVYAIHVLGISGSVLLMATHAPRDYAMKQTLIDAVMGVWTVETFAGKKASKKTINVKSVITLDEPIGGYAHLFLSDDTKRNPAFKVSSSLVLDVGGYTSDVVSLEGGTINVASIGSYAVGINNIMNGVVQYARQQYGQQLALVGNPDFDLQTLETVVQKRVIEVGALRLDVRAFVEAELTALDNEANTMLLRAGLGNAKSLILTGGGGVLLKPFIEARLGGMFANAIYLAEPNAKEIRFANVRGAFKSLGLMIRTKKVVLDGTD